MFLIFEIIFRNNKTGKKYMIVNQIREVKFPLNQQFFANCLIREIFFPRNFVTIKYCTCKINFNSDKWQVSPLLANYTKFSTLSANSADSLCRANQRNRRKFFNLEDFSFFFIKVLKLLL